MGCCKKTEPNKDNGDNQGHQHSCAGGLKHTLMMIACCLTPIGAILLLNLSGYKGTGSYLVFLLCPLMHLFMMRGMGKEQKEPTIESNTKKN